MNVESDHVKIAYFDNRLIVSVYFKDKGVAWCDYHERNRCYHIDYALRLRDVRDVYKQHGWRIPTSS